MHLRTYRCPHCFDEFKAHPDDSNDVEMAPDCGHSFTLGEARRGRPNPDPVITDDLTALTHRIETLERTVADLTERLATHQHLNLATF